MKSSYQGIYAGHTNPLLPDPAQVIWDLLGTIAKNEQNTLQNYYFSGKEGSLASLCQTSLCDVFASSIHQLRNKVSEEHDILKKKEMESGPKASHGYGGRFGVEKDRMDKVN